MLDTLRRRFILSHVMPLLVIVPIIGIALVYAIETRVLLPAVAEGLRSEALLVAELAAREPSVWTDREAAREFVTRFGRDLTAGIMLLDGQGRLLASSDAADEPLLGSTFEDADRDAALAGRVTLWTEYSPRLHSEVIQVYVPVLNFDGTVRGAIRAYQVFGDVAQQFFRLRYLVLGVLLAGLLLGTGVSLVLAVTLERPLREATAAIRRLAEGGAVPRLAERGPSDLRVLLRAVNALGARLDDLERSRRRLLANLVHELGRPLGALRSAVQALRGGADQDTSLRTELLAGMDAEIVHLRRVLDDLAHLREQIVGRPELVRRPTPTGDWLASLLATWRQAAADKGLAWRESIPANLPTLLLDTDRMASAVGNLVSNAIKYTPPGQAVVVEAGRDEAGVWVRVSDGGPGIPPEEQERVFAAFYRGAAGGRFPQGMGLGLSIAREIVAAHGGAIQLDSAPGSGARFTIRLPLSSDSDSRSP